MKKALAVLVLAVMVLGFAGASFAADPVTTFGGYNWFRYTLSYDNAKETGSKFAIERAYIGAKVKADDYEGEFTIDIPMTQYGQVVNTTAVTYTATAVQGSVDFASWVKSGYVDLTALPLLKDAEMRVRIGLQKTYFGTIDTWSYPLIEKNLEDYVKAVDSANLGVAVLGYLPMALGNFEVALYNGNGYKKLESDLDKSVCASLNIVPITGIYVRGSYLGHRIGEDRITNGQPDSKLAKYHDRKALVIGGATGPIEGFVEVLEVKDQKTGITKTGIGQSIAGFLKIKIIDGIDVNAMMYSVNPDTKVVRDEYNVYACGVNYNVASKVLLQLNYEMKQNKVGGGSSPVTNGAWMLQTKWSY